MVCKKYTRNVPFENEHFLFFYTLEAICILISEIPMDN